ncbi:hypothetical protein Tco_0378030 [Tanacetum coccineum]
MANLAFCDKHNMVAYLQKSEGSEGFHQIIDFLSTCHIKYALIESPTIYVSLIEQFWQTASASTPENGEMEITATIDGKVKVVSEASIRRHLKLEDSDGISTLPNAEIFEQLALMGYVSNSDSLTFQKGHFSPQWKFLIHTILHCLSSKKTAWEQFSSNIATAIICLATNRTFNFSKLIFEAMVKNLDSKTKFLMYPRFIQIFLNKHKRLLLPHKRTYIAPTLTHKLFSNMRRASKGYTKVNTPLFQTMLVQGQNVQEKKLEKTIKTSQARRRAKIVVSNDEEDEEDSSKQGRSLIKDMDLDAAKVLADAARIRRVENVHTYTRRRSISTGSGGVSTTSRLVSTTGMSGVSTASRLVSTVGMAQEVEINIPLLVATKDKGKAVMQESEPPKKIKKRVQYK